jgi:hypothetical protein
MKQKNLVSLSVAFAFLALSITGILLYIKQKAHAVEITHTIFGLVFVGFAVFHIINNWSSITGYSKERSAGKFKKEFIVAGLAFAVILAGAATELLEPVAEAGRIFAPKRERPERLVFEEVKTNQDLQGTALRILVETNRETELPIVAAWVEDSARGFVGNLFVPTQILVMPESEEEAREGHFDHAPFKAEELPVFVKKATDKNANSPKETPRESFMINTKTIAKGSFFVVLEVKSKDKTELYEGQISDGIAKLKANSGSLLKSVLVEVL